MSRVDVARAREMRAVTKLRKRTLLLSRARKDWHPLMRGLHAPQRDHAPKIQHPKPERTR
jgi:hypothetical protein